jgi:hypothetical protein
MMDEGRNVRRVPLFGQDSVPDIQRTPTPSTETPPARATEAPPMREAPPAPEAPATRDAQLDAMRAGRRRAVLVTPGEQMPTIPEGFTATPTEHGTFIHDPKRLTKGEVFARVDSDSHGALIGHVEPKSERTTAAVAARNPQTGAELQASYVSPENIERQAAEFKRQFPDAEIEVGDTDVEERVLADRAAATSAPRDTKKYVTPGQAPIKYGSLNKLVTAERADIARANIRRKLGFAQTNIGADPTVAKDLAEISLYHAEAGSRSLDDFILRMKEDGIELARPQMRRLLAQAHDELGETPPDDAAGSTASPGQSQDALPDLDDLALPQGTASPTRKLSLGEQALDAVNSFKSLKPSADLSAPHRQGAILTMTEPRIAARAYRDMFRSFSPAKHKQFVRNLETHPARKLADESGLYLASRDPAAKRAGVLLSEREEAFMGELIGKVPLIGHVTRFSDRTYTTFLDRLRLDTFDKFRQEITGAGGTKRDIEGIAHFVNIATGRGSLSKYGEAVAPVLNAAIFSPRFVRSRFQFLNPRTYSKMAPVARKIAMRKALGFTVATTGILTLGNLAGFWEVNLDPSSGDFGKIRIGNTRYDLWAGEQQPVRFMYRMACGFSNNLIGNKNEPFQYPKDVAEQFLRSKLSPAAGYVWNVADGKDFMGEKFDPAWGALELLAPITAGDFVEAYQAEGKTGLLKTLPGLFGVGVSTYADKSSTGNEDLSRELRALGVGLGATKKGKDESEEEHAARERESRAAIELELGTLIRSDEYKRASADERKLLVKEVTCVF